jgi:hypothetical protein
MNGLPPLAAPADAGADTGLHHPPRRHDDGRRPAVLAAAQLQRRLGPHCCPAGDVPRGRTRWRPYLLVAHHRGQPWLAAKGNTGWTNSFRPVLRLALDRNLGPLELINTTEETIMSRVAPYRSWLRAMVPSAAVAAAPAATPLPAAAGTVAGLGLASCGTWTAQRSQHSALITEQWMLGYMSRVGFSDTDDPLANTDAQGGLIAERILSTGLRWRPRGLSCLLRSIHPGRNSDGRGTPR